MSARRRQKYERTTVGRLVLARLCLTIFIFGKVMRLQINEPASAPFFS